MSLPAVSLPAVSLSNVSNWPCRHRGAELRRETCISRGQENEAAVYACAEPTIGGECTLAATSLGLVDCFGCSLRAVEDAPVLPSPSLPIPPDAFPCIHRGPFVKVEKCDLCGVRGLPFDLYECQLPEIGQCSISKRHSKVQACIGCEKRIESMPAPAILKAPYNPKLVTDAKGQPAYGWENRFRGAHAFLICGGPSLTRHDLSLLNQRGILTAAANNAGVVHRPHLLFTVDEPWKFAPQLFNDPAIAKFVRMRNAKEQLRERNGKGWKLSDRRACDSPNVWYYHDAKGVNPNTFLTEPRTTVGGKGNLGKCVMYVALRLLYWMGVRTLYLIGADFKMQKTTPYAFDEYQGAKLCGFQNEKYALVNQALTECGPHFTTFGYRVFNCTPGSGLTAFPVLDYETAVRQAIENAEATGPLTTRGLHLKP